MKFVLFGHGGYYNRGSEAIIRTTTQMLKNNFDNAKFTLVSYDYQSDRAANYGIVDEIINYGNVRYTLPHLMAYGFRKLGLQKLDVKYQHRWLKPHLESGDVFFSTGGDNYCYEEPLDYFEVDRRIKEAGKKLVLWGASVDGERITPKMHRDLKRFDAIIVREMLSYEALKNRGLTQVHLHPDPAFTMGVEQNTLPDGWKVGDTVGINLSPLSMRYAGSGTQVAVAARQMIRHILDSTTSTVALIPHVVNEKMPETQHDLKALTPLYQAFKDTGRVCLIDHANNNAKQLKGYISRCRLFIGARTHSTIAAYSTGVPTLAIGYSIKARGIARDLFGDHSQHVLPVQEIKQDTALVEAFEALQSREDKMRAHLSSIMPDYKKEALKAASHIRDVVR